MIDFEDSSPGGVGQITLPDASEAAMDVLEEVHAELAAIRHRLQQGEMPEELDIDEDELPSPREQAYHVAARLEDCAGPLRTAEEDETA